MLVVAELKLTNIPPTSYPSSTTPSKASSSTKSNTSPSSTTSTASISKSLAPLSSVRLGLIPRPCGRIVSVWRCLADRLLSWLIWLCIFCWWRSGSVSACVRESVGRYALPCFCIYRTLRRGELGGVMCLCLCYILFLVRLIIRVLYLCFFFLRLGHGLGLVILAVRLCHVMVWYRMYLCIYRRF